MANELTLSAAMRFTKGTVDEPFSFGGLTFNVSGTKSIKNRQTVGTSEEALLIGDVTPGYVLMINRDSTNFISVRGASGATACVKLLPGEIAMFRFAGSAPYVIADTAACVLEYLLVDA